MIGRRLLHYTIREALGEGGMAAVWLAHDDKLGRMVAIKILPYAVTHDKIMRARLAREARSLASRWFRSLMEPNAILTLTLTNSVA